MDGLNLTNKLLGRMDLYGLMLLPIGKNKAGDLEFTRCGMFHIYYGNDTKRLHEEFKACLKGSIRDTVCPQDESGKQFRVKIV